MSVKKTKDVVTTTTVAPEEVATTTAPPTCPECAAKQKEISSLKTKLNSANGKVGHLTQIVEKLNAEKKNLQESLTDALTENHDLKTENCNLKQRNNSLKEEVSELKSELAKTVEALETLKVNLENYLSMGTFARVKKAMNAKKLSEELLESQV